MGTIKDRNGIDLTEAEDIKKRWQDFDVTCSGKHNMSPGARIEPLLK